MVVAAVGQPSALPAPQRKDGVLTGTGLFSASGPPQAWVTGLPGITVERRGQLIALTGTAAAYVSGDGVVYLSGDSGKTWRRSTWTPWGRPQETVGIWRQGKDYWVDFPSGDHRGALRLVWFDHRVASEEKIILTRLTQSGDWLRLAEIPGEVKTKNGEQLSVTQILVPKGGRLAPPHRLRGHRAGLRAGAAGVRRQGHVGGAVRADADGREIIAK